MAFDLSTAKPAGFDISTAQPFQEDDAPPEENRPSTSEIEQAFQSIPGAPILSEIAAGANRSIAGVIDFFGPDTINAALNIAGSDKRVPTLTEAITVPKGTFTEPGLAQDIAAGVGEAGPVALGFGALLRQAASRLPAFTAGESTGVGVTRQLGATTPGQDIAIGATSAAGGVVGREAGGDVGEVVGALAAPLGASAPRQAGQAVTRGVTGAIAPEAQATLAAGEAAGVPVLTTDVLPPKGIVGGLARQFGERIPLFGTSGARAGQQQAREAASADLANSLPRTTADDIVQSLQGQVSKVKSAAGNRLEGFKTRLDEAGEIGLFNTQKAIDDSIQRLESAKIETDFPTIQKLADISTGAKEAHTFSMLRDARTAVREAADSSDPLLRSQLPSKSKAALKSVERAITKDLDNFVEASEGARGLARYKEADRVWASEANKLTKSRLKNVLDKGDITPEIAETMLLSRKPSEVKLLHDSLTTQGKQAARSSLINSAIKRAGGVEDISPTRLANELKRIRANTDIFFKGKDRQQLNGLQKLLTETKRAQESAVVTPTGQSLTALVGIGAGSQVGLVESLLGAATAGGAARLYESPAVRNFLLRLANTPRTSPRFKKLIDDSLPQIQAAVQATQESR